MTDPALATFTALFGPEFGHRRAFDLAKLRTALDALGAPHERLPPTIHVAGTNGKSSTVAFMRAIAEAAGFRVHAFTKPHLHGLNERFLVAGKQASDGVLIAAADRIGRLDPTLSQFDAQVAAAFLLFSETPADLALIETGMGGRDDSSNVITPALSVLTPIALDHQDALGPNLADIASHKAGILKPNIPAIMARQGDDVRAIAEAHARAIGAPLWRQGAEWDCHASVGRLVVQTESRALDLPLPVLAGGHQLDNAGLAAAALLRLRPDIADDAFAHGIVNARCPGRLQSLTRGPLAARAPNAEIWIDGGHNPHAAQVLASALAEMNTKRPARTALIIGLRARKDWRAFVQSLAPQAAQVIAVPLLEECAPPEQIAAAAREAGVEATTANDLRHALGQARGAGRILMCGSFLLAAEALAESD